MENIKQCKQCGEHKQLQDFRKLYTGKGYYGTCLKCESVNNRYKYLKARLNLTEKQEQEKKDIEELYELLRLKGLRPPMERTTVAKDVYKTVQHMREEMDKKMKEAGVDEQTPMELLRWLTEDLSKYDPEYLQEDVIEALKTQYRPQIGIDSETLLPKYDDTYRQILNKIEKRFDDYEDELL